MSAGAVIHRIKKLGLTVASQKTEAVVFCRQGIPLSIPQRVAGETIYTEVRIKHLAVILDRCLTYKLHFEYVEEKAYKILRAL